jgi:Protein of unknown function (DUF3710)
MAFGRGKKDKKDPDVDGGPLDDDTDGTPSADSSATTDATATDAGTPLLGARRPLDDEEAGGDATMPRLDLGCLRVPVLPGTEVRVEMNEAQQPIAATIVHGTNSLQVLVFAAPRHSGIWDEVRTEIAESVRTDGGQVDEIEGDFGTELHTRVRNEVAGKVTEQQLRFVGFDGPRWFLRGVFSGPAATDRALAEVLETVLTSIVVVRGTDPMAPRDPLQLRLPREATAAREAAEAADGDGDGGRPAAQVFELPDRSREITETS